MLTRRPHTVPRAPRPHPKAAQEGFTTPLLPLATPKTSDYLPTYAPLTAPKRLPSPHPCSQHPQPRALTLCIEIADLIAWGFLASFLGESA